MDGKIDDVEVTVDRECLAVLVQVEYRWVGVDLLAEEEGLLALSCKVVDDLLFLSGVFFVLFEACDEGSCERTPLRFVE